MGPNYPKIKAILFDLKNGPKRKSQSDLISVNPSQLPYPKPGM